MLKLGCSAINLLEMASLEIPVSNQDIAQYYDTSQWLYSLFWSKDALHYGFWYNDTKNLAEAIINENQFVCDTLGITAHDIVLDAGCGVGGTSFYIAEHSGAKVEGITLSKVQLDIAKKRAAQSKVHKLVNFSLQDFTQTNFADKTFSKVFGMESMGYARSKLDLLKEMYRILQPGGKLLVIDAFLSRENLTAEENKWYVKFMEGWRGPNLTTNEQFKNLLAQVGFKNITFRDMKEQVEKSAQIIYRNGLLMYLPTLIFSRLGLMRENFAGYYQKKLIDSGVGIYGVFVAEKPKN